MGFDARGACRAVGYAEPGMTDDITKLPVKFKTAPPTERVLLAVPGYKCLHQQFEVDSDKAEVTCAQCKEKLNPMYVLNKLANKETQWHVFFQRYQEELRRLNERSHTKCIHCGKMTRISHR